MSSTTFHSPSLIAARFLLSGVVQGVGMRPRVARLASACGLNGFVRNDGLGVEIHVEGSAARLDSFAALLRTELPPSSRIKQRQQIAATVTYADVFRIEPSHSAKSVTTEIPLDRAVCPTCLAESFDPSNRRHQYPFVTCTDCGPRYSLLGSMPFDRDATSMNAFDLCSECILEYGAADDRRFHAQTNACPACGPQLKFLKNGVADCRVGRSAVSAAAEHIRRGGIVAMKGIGGYQLVCDATCTSVVERLRLRKRRPRKPLAVMVTSVAAAKIFANISAAAEVILRSPQNPIVVMPASSGEWLSPAINPGLCDVGVMLPTSPLHALLFKEVGLPCVVTSGNFNGAPLEFQVNKATAALNGIADGWLHHNRDIVHPVDDSVVRVMANRPVTLRAARGLAPMSLNVRTAEIILATGGHQKVAVALSNGTQSVLGPHVGDMNSVSTRQRFVDHVQQFCELYQMKPTVIAHDLHPDYFTTHWAADQKVKTIAVQHHHAHTVAGMVEHGWLDRRVLGVCFDGTGYGTDGTIWGGEFLVCTSHSFRRVARLRPFPLLGGETAIHEPWRISAALLHESGIDDSDSPVAGRPSAKVLSVNHRRLTSCRSLSPVTSSMGRLFDGVAALLLDIADVSFEGEGAMRLEAVCDFTIAGEYDLPICHVGLMELDWRPMIREIVDDMRSDLSVVTIATKLTRSIATAVARVCQQFPDLPPILSGGCFQNAVLTELTSTALKSHPQPVGLPGDIPPNDGGLAAGQLAVAATQLRQCPLNEGSV